MKLTDAAISTDAVGKNEKPQAADLNAEAFGTFLADRKRCERPDFRREKEGAEQNCAQGAGRRKPASTLKIAEGPPGNQLRHFGARDIDEKLVQGHEEEIHHNARENERCGRHAAQPSQCKNQRADQERRQKGGGHGAEPQFSPYRKACGDRERCAKARSRGDAESRRARKCIGRDRLNLQSGQRERSADEERRQGHRQAK